MAQAEHANPTGFIDCAHATQNIASSLCNKTSQPAQCAGQKSWAHEESHDLPRFIRPLSSLPRCRCARNAPEETATANTRDHSQCRCARSEAKPIHSVLSSPRSVGSVGVRAWRPWAHGSIGRATANEHGRELSATDLPGRNDPAADEGRTIELALFDAELVRTSSARYVSWADASAPGGISGNRGAYDGSLSGRRPFPG